MKNSLSVLFSFLFVVGQLLGDQLWKSDLYPPNGEYRSVGMGLINDSKWPWVYNLELGEWMYVAPGSSLEEINLFRARDTRWLWTKDSIGKVFYNFNDQEWEGVVTDSELVFYYMQGFANDSGSFQSPDLYGWQFYFDTGATPGAGNRIHYFNGADPVENVNSLGPFGDNISNGVWTGNSEAIQLAFTEITLTEEQAANSTLTMSINTNSDYMPMHFAIRVEGSWFVSDEYYVTLTPSWPEIQLPIGGDTAWIPMTFSPGVVMRVESSPVMNFSEFAGVIDAVGVYMEPQGTHRFDNFGVIMPNHLSDIDDLPPIPVPPVARQDMIDSMLRYFGQGPSETVDPEVEELEVIDEEDHRRIHVRYLVDEDEFSYAYILLPFPLPEPDEKLPTVLALHPTSALGKDRVTGIYENPPASDSERLQREARQYALDLVRKGFVVFAPDRAAFGQRQLLDQGNTTEQMNAYRDFLSGRYPGFRLTSGKNVWDLQRALDFLVELPYVDRENIGAIGHSLGAWDSIMLLGMDERIKAAVVNSGGMVNYVEELWTDPDTLRNYLSGSQNLNINVNVWMMLAAPKSLLYNWSLQDGYETGGPHLLEGYRTISEYWEDSGRTSPSYNRSDLTFYLHGNGHDFPPEARALSYRFLIERLNLSR